MQRDSDARFSSVDNKEEVMVIREQREKAENEA